MAVVDITQYASLAVDGSGRQISVGMEPCIANVQVAIGGSSVQSAAFNDNTRLVRVHTDAAIRIAFGANPTAASTSQRMAAGQTEYFGVRPGEKAAVITTT